MKKLSVKLLWQRILARREVLYSFLLGLCLFFIVGAVSPQIFEIVKIKQYLQCDAFYKLTGAFCFYPEDAATSIAATTAATNSNTPSTIVKRDSSGDFSAGTITASLSGLANQALYWKTSGTGQAAISGPAAGTTRTYTFPNANATILYSGGALGTPASGTLTNCTFPTLNQNTTGSAASLSISGQTGLLSFTGLASTNRIKTVRDAADTLLELGGSYTPSGTWNWTSAAVTWPTFNQNTTGSSASCTGNAATVTNGVYTSGNQSIAGEKTFTDDLKIEQSTNPLLKINTPTTSSYGALIFQENGKNNGWLIGFNSAYNIADRARTMEVALEGHTAPIWNNFTVQQSNDTVNAVSTLFRLRHEAYGSASPVAGIGVGMSFVTETANDNYETGGKFDAVTTDVTGGSEDFDYVWSLMAAGAAAAEKMRLTSTGLLSVVTGFMPDANDGAYLGQAGTAFSDLFLAEGGVINWDSGDATLTQVGNDVTLAGASLSVESDLYLEDSDNVQYIYFKGSGGNDYLLCNNGPFKFSNSLECTALTATGAVTLSGISAGAGTYALKWTNSAGTVTKDTSSLRYKTDLEYFDAGDSRLLEADPFRYTHIVDGERTIGFAAEQLDELGLEDLIIYDEQGRPDAIKYDRIDCYLIPIVKKQQAQINELRADLDDLRARLDKLENKK